MTARFRLADFICLAVCVALALGTIGCQPAAEVAEGVKPVRKSRRKTETEPVADQAAPEDSSPPITGIRTPDSPPDDPGDPGAGGERPVEPAGGERLGAAEPKAEPKKAPVKKHAEKPNRLAEETSPYLLMHAYNPVDWYPWGEEAFAKAKKENKAIFLSVGYSSCYWCHVMERESFLDEEIAEYLNEHFVCIKVDREERPDVDDIYMRAVQLINRGGGGWPLSAFLTPDAKPFFGGTYFPARAGDRRGYRVGFLEIIRIINDSWSKEPEVAKQSGEELAALLKKVMREQRDGEPVQLEAAMLDNVQQALAGQFDPVHGGFGYVEFGPPRPKFPSPSDLLFLAERMNRNKEDQEAKKMLLLTLDNMAQGGIRDHLGGGFHRYSVDRFWRIPHFEKMLYDNAQLATVYAEAYRLTGREDYRRVLVELLDFVLREMTDEQGAFHAAIDAETDEEEGKFYRWEQEELESLLTADELKLLGDVYGLSGEPNFEEEYYVLLLDEPLEKIAGGTPADATALEEKLAPLRAKLLAARDKRKRPLTDTKVLTAWNGLMIRGFADSGRILKEERFTAAAARAADFILKELKTADGRLLRTYREGEAKLNAYIDDYAFLVDGLIALHRATGDARWLDAAAQLTDKQIELFWDDDGNGFYFTSGDHETLIARAKKRTDSVLPSGNAVSAANLIYLARALDNEDYLQRAEKTISAFADGLADENEAGSMTRMAAALAALLERKPATAAPQE